MTVEVTRNNTEKETDQEGTCTSAKIIEHNTLGNERNRIVKSESEKSQKPFRSSGWLNG